MWQFGGLPEGPPSLCTRSFEQCHSDEVLEELAVAETDVVDGVE